MKYFSSCAVVALVSTLSSCSLERANGFVMQHSGSGARDSSLGLSPLLNEFSSAYTYSLTHYQLATESATAACLAGIGDVVAQVTATDDDTKPSQSSFDWKRSQTFVAKGAVSGIMWSYWYAQCDAWSLNFAQHCVQDAGAVRAVQLATSILLEQFVWCPLLYSMWDIPFPILCRGDSIEEIPNQVKSKIGPLLLENAKVWTFANLLVYNIPLQWRVVVVSLTDVVWQSIVSSSIAATTVPPPLPSGKYNTALEEDQPPVEVLVKL